jgi:hypothetical protein
LETMATGLGAYRTGEPISAAWDEERLVGIR